MPDFQTMMLEFNKNMPELFLLVQGISFTLGIILFVRVMFKLRKAADYRSMMYQPTELIGPMVGIFIATVLIYAPSMMDATTATFFGGVENMLDQEFEDSRYSRSSAVIKAVLTIIKFVGLISFIRGWTLMLKATDQGSAGQGFFGKGLVHIIAGVFAWHIWWTVQLIAGTFGIPLADLLEGRA